MRSDVQRIVDIYRASGRYDVRVDPKIIELPNGRVDLVFEITEGRKTTKEKIDAVAQGRVWTGRQALERGLVDELGGLDRAIRLAKERAKLDVSKDVELLIYPQKPSIYDIFAHSFGGVTETRMSTAGQLTGQLSQAKAIESMANMLRRFRRGEALMLMPNVFVR